MSINYYTDSNGRSMFSVLGTFTQKKALAKTSLSALKSMVFSQRDLVRGKDRKLAKALELVMKAEAGLHYFIEPLEFNMKDKNEKLVFYFETSHILIQYWAVPECFKGGAPCYRKVVPWDHYSKEGFRKILNYQSWYYMG